MHHLYHNTDSTQKWKESGEDSVEEKNGGKKYTKSFPLGKKRLLLYCAAIRRGKGVFWLLENYRRKGYHNSELHLVGPLELDNGRREKSKISRHIGQCKKQWLLSGKRSNNMESVESESETFLRLLKKSGAIFDGEISRGELTGKLQDAFAVIIPSIAFENYPNIGLEAIACNCLVCGTDNGGIPELVASGKLLFRHDRQCQDRKFALKLSNKRVSKILKSVKISRGSEKHN